MKLKNIVVPAVFGFALSFFISIVVNHRFGTAFLRGLIFGVAFAAMAVVIDFVYEKFLNDGSSIDFTSDAPKSDSRVGGKVDITIDDAELTDNGDALSFSVLNNRFKLSEADTKSARQSKNDILNEVKSSSRPVSSVAASTPAADSVPSETEKPAFKPVALGTPVGKATVSDAIVSAAPSHVEDSPSSKVSAAESTTSESHHTVSGAENVSPALAARRAERVADKKEIDALPDLDSFGDEGDLDDDVIEDSEFAQDGLDSSSDEGRIIFADGSKAKDHDTETLAKAIRTVLKRED